MGMVLPHELVGFTLVHRKVVGVIYERKVVPVLQLAVIFEPTLMCDNPVKYTNDSDLGVVSPWCLLE